MSVDGQSLSAGVSVFFFHGEPTLSSREKGWHPVTVSLVNMVLKKPAQLFVKLLDRAESKAVGIWKEPLALGSVWRDLLEGGAEAVFVASPW